VLYIPKKGRQLVEHNTGTVAAAFPATTVTTGAAATTKGAVAQLIASTSFDAYFVRIMAMGYGAAAVASEGAMDLLIGAATEDVLIANLLMGYCGGAIGSGLMTGIKQWVFPLYVPAGSRLSIQAAGARVSTTFRVGIYLYGNDGPAPSRWGQKVTTYGMGTVPNGVAITPGASGAEGAFTQIVAATTEDHFALFPSFQVSADTTVNNRNLLLDVGIGAATEEEIAQSLWYYSDNNEEMGGPFPCDPIYCDIPSGTRLAMRVSNSNVNDGAYNGVLHCVS
jgi:hypothetical protein